MDPRQVGADAGLQSPPSPNHNQSSGCAWYWKSYVTASPRMVYGVRRSRIADRLHIRMMLILDRKLMPGHLLCLCGTCMPQATYRGRVGQRQWHCHLFLVFQSRKRFPIKPPAQGTALSRVRPVLSIVFQPFVHGSATHPKECTSGAYQHLGGRILRYIGKVLIRTLPTEARVRVVDTGNHLAVTHYQLPVSLPAPIESLAKLSQSLRRRRNSDLILYLILYLNRICCRPDLELKYI